MRELARSELINTRCAAVAQAAAVTASPQIRNIATTAGNVMQDRRCIYFNQSEQWRGALPLCYKTGGEVCHQIPNSPVCRAIYYSDLATALIALDAEAGISGAGRASPHKRAGAGAAAFGLQWPFVPCAAQNPHYPLPDPASGARRTLRLL